MNHIFEEEKTREHLNTWAGTKTLYTASYYFWNQGSEIQKSDTGMIQSLLYQILRVTPEFAPDIAAGRMHHEVWNIKSLRKAF